MKCPVCNTEMKIVERQGIEIDHCLQCRGVWLDLGELEKLIERSQAIAISYKLEQDEDEDRRCEEERHGKPEKRRR